MLEVVERELRNPRPDEVRVRVQAASVSLVDVQARQGRGPFQQKASFVPAMRWSARSTHWVTRWPPSRQGIALRC